MSKRPPPPDEPSARMDEESLFPRDPRAKWRPPESTDGSGISSIDAISEDGQSQAVFEDTAPSAPAPKLPSKATPSRPKVPTPSRAKVPARPEPSWTPTPAKPQGVPFGMVVVMLAIVGVLAALAAFTVREPRPTVPVVPPPWSPGTGPIGPSGPAPPHPPVALPTPSPGTAPSPPVVAPDPGTGPQPPAPPPPTKGPKRTVGPRKSLRELAPRSPHHEAVARVLLTFDPSGAPDDPARLEREQRLAMEIKQLGGPAVRAIEDMALEIDEDADRRVLVRALALIDDPDATRAAGEVLCLLHDNELQRIIMRALPETPDGSESIATAFSLENDAKTRLDLLNEYARRLRATGKEEPGPPVDVPDSEVDEFLRRAAFDSDRRVRAETIALIQRRAQGRDALLLEDVVTGEKDASLRAAALVAYGVAGQETGLPLLVKTAESDASAEVRAAAVEGIALVKGDEAIATLEKLIQGSAPADVKRLAGEKAALLRLNR